MARRHIAASFFCASLWAGFLGQAQAVMPEPSTAPADVVPGAVVPRDRSLTIAQTLNGYTLLHVSPTAGDDMGGDGGQMQPFKTITHALRVAEPSTIIVLSPGLYTEASGETFPLQLRPGVTLQGTPSPNTANVVIQGSGSYLTPSQGLRHITLLGTDRAGLANVTVSNPHPQGHGLWIEAGSPVIVQNAFIRSGATGIYIGGNGSPTIQGNYFFENGDAGLVVNGPSSAQVQNNVFENTGVGIAVAPAATPLIVGNHISHNQDGLILHAEARPQLRNNQILNNRRNSVLDYSPWPDAAPASVAAAPPPASPQAVAPEPTVTVISPAVEPEPSTITTSPPVAVIPAPAAIATPAPTFEPLTVAAVPADTAPSAAVTEPRAVGLEATPPAQPEIPASNLTLPSVPDLPSLPEDTIPIAVTAPAADHADLVAATAEAPIDRAADLRSRLQQRRSATRVAISAPAAPATFEPAIDIPVIPAPESAPEVSVAPLATPSAAPREPIASNILIVPGQNIPIGNGGSTSLATGITSEDGPPAPPSRATILGLYYRVFVDANTEASRAQLEALIPDAFQVQVNDQPMMQAGAFNTLAEAQATSGRLNQAGLRARVEYIP